MELLIIALVWIVNFAISWWNARSVGLVWAEVKFIGGWQRLLTWMGAIMSASGFTWCYLIVLLLGGYYAQFSFIAEGDPLLIDQEGLISGLSLGYIIIIPGILFSGLMIWIDSLIQAWRRKDLPSMGIAAWNTFAQIHNTYSAIETMPDAFKSAGKLFDSKGGDSKSKGALLIFALVIIAILGGILTTRAIIGRHAGTRPIENSNRQRFSYQ